MKARRVAVFVESVKKKELYQVALTESEMGMILNLIGQMHGGSIKCRDEKYPHLSLGKVSL